MKKIALTIILAFTVAFVSYGQKFAFVDTEYILENIPEYDLAQDQLDELSVQWQKEIEEKFADIDKLYKSYRAESALLPEDMKKKREEEIINKEKEAKKLQKQRFGKEGDLFKKRQELIKPIQDRVYDAVSEIAETKNLAIIFDRSGSLTMLYGNAKYDLSDEVLDKLGYEPGGVSKEK